MRSLSWARLALILIVAIIVQVGVLNEIVVFGAHPDVMVLVAVGGGVVAGPARGAAIGFVAGIVADLAVTLPFGLSALTFVFVGFGSAYLRTAALGRDFGGVDPLLGAVGAGAGTILYAVLGTLIGQKGFIGPQLVPIVAVVAVGAAVLAIPVIALIGWALEPSSSPASFVPTGGSATG